MKRNIFGILVAVLLLLPGVALAQVSISVTGGYGSWRMSTMKEWQESYRNSFPVEARTLAAYPDHLFFEAAVKHEKAGWVRGLAIATGSTGGRVYYSDYSGRISLDQSLSFYSFSAIIGKTLNKQNEKFLLVASLCPGINLSRMSYDYEQVIYDGETEERSNSFSGLNVTLQPTFSVIRKFGRLGLEAQLGYLLPVVSGKLTYHDETKIPADVRGVDYLTYGDQIPVTANWSGYRIGLGVSFQLK